MRLTSADGTGFDAHVTRATGASEVGAIVLPDLRGLHPFYRDLADRLAAAGIHAAAVDYFGRTAPEGPRGDHFDYRVHVERTRPATVDADAAAAAAWLRSPGGAGVRRVFSIGFGFGASNAWRLAATQPGLAGAIGFYGQPARVRHHIDRMRAPLLVVVAGADFTPAAEFELFDRQLTAAGVEHEMRTYEGAPHGFFDRACARHPDACADAWDRLLEFIARRQT